MILHWGSAILRFQQARLRFATPSAFPFTPRYAPAYVPPSSFSLAQRRDFLLHVRFFMISLRAALRYFHHFIATRHSPCRRLLHHLLFQAERCPQVRAAGFFFFLLIAAPGCAFAAFAAPPPIFSPSCCAFRFWCWAAVYFSFIFLSDTVSSAEVFHFAASGTFLRRDDFAVSAVFRWCSRRIRCRFTTASSSLVDW